MKFKAKGLVSILLCLVLAISAFTGVPIPEISTTASAADTTEAQTSDNDYGLLDDVEGGLILHCWCWSFNTIKENLEQIAEAGYTAVQTSPISKCVVGENGGMQLYGSGKWYYHYQPTEYSIGNYQLGTEAEFKALCTAAHSYGIKVIADVVANHTTTDTGSVSSAITGISGGAYHNNGSGIDYSSRYDVTQKDLIGLPDLNTQNTNVQNMILSFLKQAVADGADGFRYDAAKHIELPDDDSSYASNFWPTVLDNGSSFQYGEILEDEYGTARSEAYAEYMHVTASSYGYILREQISSRQITASKMSNYNMSGVSEDRMVTWVESHDNYCDDDTWQDYDNTQIRLCWAIAVAQGDTTSLFFNRPNGSSTSNKWGNNVIGEVGDSNYYDDEVVAVNHFHNAMYGQDKELKNIDGNSAVLMISRGSSGVVIVNDSTSSVSVNTETSLADGTYTDYAHGGTFTVSGGVLSGTVGSEQIAVLYTDTVTHDPSVSISYNGSNEGGDFYGTAEITLKSKYAQSAYLQLNSGTKIAYTSGDVISIGSDISEGESVTLTLTATGENGATVSKSYTFTKLSQPTISGTTCIYYDNSSTNWSEVYVYAYRDGGNTENSSWPGQAMTYLGDDIWGYALDDSWSDAYIIFNNNNNGEQYPSGEGFTISKGESKICTDSSWQTYGSTPSTTSTATVITTGGSESQTTTASESTSTTSSTTTQAVLYYGDANCDGNINISDVTAIQKYLASLSSLSTQGKALALVSSNSSISIKDATCIQKYIASMGGSGLTGTVYNK